MKRKEPEHRTDTLNAPGEIDCSWRTNGRRCLLLGTISPHIGDNVKRYCHWHYVCLSNPKIAENYDEFCRWNDMWANYCSTENHHENAEFWEAIQGRTILGKVTKWCGLVWCRHFSITETVKWWTPKPTPPQYRQSKPRTEPVEFIHAPTPTQISKEELDRQKQILLRMNGIPASEEVPF